MDLTSQVLHDVEFEAPGAEEISVAIDSTRPLSDQVKLIYDELRRLLFG